MTPFVRLGVIALLGIGLAGCGASLLVDTTTDSTPRATTVATDADHPCNDIDDATLRSIGLNPASRRTLQPGPTRTSACSFTSSDLHLTVAASSTSFEDYRNRNQGISEGLDIGSHPALMVRRPGSEGPCQMAIRSSDGIVLLTTKISVSAREWGMDPCGGMKQIANAIGPAIFSR